MAQNGLSSPPFIDVEGIHNFRDIGGYPVSSSSSGPTSTRRGLVYRCADPSRITSLGKEKMHSLGIRTIFDLRSKPEIAKAGEKAMQNVESIGVDIGAPVKRVFAPAFLEEDYSPESLALRYAAYARGGPEGFTQAYREILHNAGPSFGIILRHLRDYANRPFVCHCSAGKDRTGIITALILGLAGADDETIAKEYALTEQGLGPLKEVIIKHVLENDSLGGDRDKAEKMTSARYENMVASVEMIHAEFGGFVGYVKKYCRLTDEDVEQIRKNIVVNVAPIL